MIRMLTPYLTSAPGSGKTRDLFGWFSLSLPNKQEKSKMAGGSTDYLAKELLELETRAKALRAVANELFRDKVLLHGERAAVDIIASYIWIARDLIRAAGEREIQREIEDNKEG